jgi:phosphinothricin acetyltransferase
MADALIRPATKADIGAITGIYGEAVLHGTASFEIEPPDEAEMAKRFDALTGRGYPYIVAETSGRVAGYAYAGPYHSRPGYRYSVENSIYVAPDAQGKGIGNSLLAELIRLCEGKGFRQMIAVIGNSQNLASIALHRCQGFRFCGVIHSVGFKHGRWLDSVIMQRSLGEGDRTLPPSL